MSTPFVRKVVTVGPDRRNPTARLTLVVLFAVFSALAVAAEVSAPVIIDGRELWTIKVPRAGFSPGERAEDVRASILSLADDPRRSLDDAREVHLESESILLGGRVYLFSVTSEDARVAGKPREVLFAEHKRIALEAVRRYRESRAFAVTVRSAALAFGALVGAFLAMVMLRFAHRRASLWVSASLERLSHREHVGALYRELETSVAFIANLSLRIAFLSTALLLALIAIEFALGLFPATAGLAGNALSGALDVARMAGAGVIAYVPNLFVLALVAGSAIALIQLAGALARAVEAGRISLPNFHREWARPTYGLIRVLLVLFALVVAFPYLPGGDSPALRGVSLFIGVLISLGSGSAMGNVIAGVIITYMRPFQIGDRVQIADSVGDVTEKSLLVTRIRTIKNVEVIVPNNAILGAHIVNYSANARDHGLILSTSVTIGYDAPWQTVRELLIRAALRTPHILPEPKPFVFHTSLNDYHVSYEINAITREANLMAYIYSELHTNIQEEFNTAGIEIMSPTYFSLRDGNTVTIPAEQRSRNYVAPFFRVQTASPDELPSVDRASAKHTGGA